MYDSIIIGTGPAGLSAALNLKTYKKKNITNRAIFIARFAYV